MSNYSSEQLEFLKLGYSFMKIRDLTKAFNLMFDLDKTEQTIKAALNNHSFTCGRKGNDRLIDHPHLLTDEQEQFLRDKYPDHSQIELTKLCNDHFGLSLTEQQISTFLNNHGILSGRTGCFEKGDLPWNTGTKGATSANKTSFEKGHAPANRKPMWDERICTKNGHILMKVPEKNPYTNAPTRYKAKHVYVYEQVHGPIPKGCVVFFLDGDNLNCDPENLIAVSRAELLNLNRLGYKDAPAELKPSLLLMSKLQVATWEREKR